MAWTPIQNANWGASAANLQGVDLSKLVSGYQQGQAIADQRDARKKRKDMEGYARDAATESAPTALMGTDGSASQLQGMRDAAWAEQQAAFDRGDMAAEAAGAQRTGGFDRALQSAQTMPAVNDRYVFAGKEYANANQITPEMQNTEAMSRYAQKVGAGGYFDEAMDARSKAQAYKLGGFQLNDAQRKDDLSVKLAGQATAAEQQKAAWLEHMKAAGPESADGTLESVVRHAQAYSNKVPGMGNIIYDPKENKLTISGPDGIGESHSLKGKTAAELNTVLTQLGISSLTSMHADERNSMSGDYGAIEKSRLGRSTAAELKRHNSATEANQATSAQAAMAAATRANIDTGGGRGIATTWNSANKDWNNKNFTYALHDPNSGAGGDRDRADTIKYDFPKTGEGDSGIGIVMQNGKTMPYSRSAEFGIDVPTGTSSEAVQKRYAEARAAGIEIGTIPVGDSKRGVTGVVWAYMGKDGEPFETMKAAQDSLKKPAEKRKNVDEIRPLTPETRRMFGIPNTTNWSGQIPPR